MLSYLKNLVQAKPTAPPSNSILINAYCTIEHVPALNFPHQLNNRRTHRDPELFTHLNGFIGYILQLGDGKMTRIRYHTMRHLQRVQCQISLSIEESQLDAYSAWAEQANAIAFLPDGSVRDAQGRILLAADGSGDAGAEIPYPQLAWQRKARSDALLASQQLYVPQDLPPQVCESELQLRPAQEVAQRALALLVTATRAESIISGEGLSRAFFAERMPLALPNLSAKEQEFFNIEQPDEASLPQFSWRYESLLVLEWALGLTDELPFPSQICDVGACVARILDVGGEQILQQAALRPSSEILDALDLHYRLHWRVRESSAREQEPAANLEAGVVYERHYALNWLVQFENASWDEVDTPT